MRTSPPDRLILVILAVTLKKQKTDFGQHHDGPELLTRTGSLVPSLLSADMSRNLQRPCEVSARNEGCSARHDLVRFRFRYQVKYDYFVAAEPPLDDWYNQPHYFQSSWLVSAAADSVHVSWQR